MRNQAVLRRPVSVVAALAALLGVALSAEPAAAAEPSYLRLTDRLDRPQDGYCLDVLGSGGAFRVDMPLMAHNCKPAAAPDGLVVFTAEGRLAMPAFGACVTAMGVQRTLLAGAALMLKRCDAEEAFLRAAPFQRFAHRPDGRLEVVGYALCVAVGEGSERTFSPAHAWRTLFLTDCAAADPALSTWEFVAPYP